MIKLFHFSVIFAECETLNTTWRNVKSTQTLPVQHGTDLTLYCDEHYTNMGGDKVTCQDGNFVSSTSPPDCKGEYRSGEKGDHSAGTSVSRLLDD